MPQHEPDKSSKWLIQHHRDTMLRLGGFPQVRRWHAKQAEIVQPKKLPDGLLEVWFEGQKKSDYVLLELATYPEQRCLQQAVDDLVLAYQFLGKLPELLMLVLAPKGRLRIPGNHTVDSRLGSSQVIVNWKVVELWTLPAEDLFAVGDVGLIPWIPLTRFDEPPEVVFERCRERIEQRAPVGQKEQLFAVSQVLAGLRYNDKDLLSLLGGKAGMSEFPIIRQFVREAEQKTKHEDILRILEVRHGEIPEDLPARVRRFRSEKRLNALLDFAAVCQDLDAFRNSLRS